jgi:putative alpha-1,2-mannosidase
MASWFLLSSMGIYPLCVGDAHYTLTSPLFDRVTLHLPGGKTFVFSTAGNSDFAVYVKSRRLNGESYNSTTISHETIVRGGELSAEMSEKPNDSIR